MSKKRILSVQNLTVTLRTDSVSRDLLSDISFEIEQGKTFVLLGESGSGKSMTALSILQLLPPKIQCSNEKGHILFEDRDLLHLTEKAFRKIRGGKIAMIFQEPMTSLNPVMTVGKQIEESLKIHRSLQGDLCQNEVLQLLENVKLKNSKRIAASYPHQLSGGMKQRVMIAMALAGNPKLLIADEPTTALDVTTQAEILALLKALQAEYGMSMLFITHDLQIANEIADEVAILQKGRIQEQGQAQSVLNNPQHPYCIKLVSAIPTLRKADIDKQAESVLKVSHLIHYYPIRKGLFNRLKYQIKAVDDVSFQIRAGETLGLVGETGCGKTTLAKIIMALIKPSFGKVELLNHTISDMPFRKLKQFRTEFQMIFQDPYGALNPRMRVIDILMEGMLALNVGRNYNERLDRIDVLLNQVGLLPEHKYRYPHQFSGGQRQRICIARALSVGPRLIVCDEPTSSLDASVQAQIIDLFISLQNEFELSYLFISHNLSLIKAIAHHVAVMQGGQIVELGSVEQILYAPQHPYTQSLLKASYFHSQKH